MAAAVNLLQQVRKRSAAHDKKRALHRALQEHQDLRQVFVAPGHIDPESNSLPRGLPADHRVGIVRSSDCGAQLMPDRATLPREHCPSAGPAWPADQSGSRSFRDDGVVGAVVDGVDRVSPVVSRRRRGPDPPNRAGRIADDRGYCSLARILRIPPVIVLAGIIFTRRSLKSRSKYDTGGKHANRIMTIRTISKVFCCMSFCLLSVAASSIAAQAW